MNKSEIILIWFSYNDISFARAEQFLSKFDDYDMLFDKNNIKNAVFNDIHLNDIKEKLLKDDLERFEDKIINELYKYNLTAITYNSKNYPEKLKDIADPPLVLYVRGDASLLNKKSISIVGTRKPTDYGKIVTEKFVRELSGAGLVTVSGLAYGIDTIVAKSTLDAGGKTIAVLAGGLDVIYPSQNKALAERIVETGGLILSEARPKQKPLQFAFISRNRIVSALGLGTLIVEAGKHSGTMTTARCALEQGRELFVVPGNIYCPQSEGTNNLINEIPDSFTISPDRILYKLKIKKKVQAEKQDIQVDTSESQILQALSKKELTFDELCEITGILPGELSANLIKLEMFGLVKKGDANTYFKL